MVVLVGCVWHHSFLIIIVIGHKVVYVVLDQLNLLWTLVNVPGSASKPFLVTINHVLTWWLEMVFLVLLEVGEVLVDLGLQINYGLERGLLAILLLNVEARNVYYLDRFAWWGARDKLRGVTALGWLWPLFFLRIDILIIINFHLVLAKFENFLFQGTRLRHEILTLDKLLEVLKNVHGVHLLVLLEHIKCLQILLVQLFLIRGQVVESAVESEMTRIVLNSRVGSWGHYFFGALSHWLG